MGHHPGQQALRPALQSPHATGSHVPHLPPGWSEGTASLSVPSCSQSLGSQHLLGFPWQLLSEPPTGSEDPCAHHLLQEWHLYGHLSLPLGVLTPSSLPPGTSETLVNVCEMNKWKE